MRWWIRLLIAIIVIALLLWLGWGLVQGITTLINNVDLNAGEVDPMFAEEIEIPTRPPELDVEETPQNRPTLDDYAPTQGAPVDKTAEELIREAQMKQSEA